MFLVSRILANISSDKSQSFKIRWVTDLSTSKNLFKDYISFSVIIILEQLIWRRFFSSWVIEKGLFSFVDSWAKKVSFSLLNSYNNGSYFFLPITFFQSVNTIFFCFLTNSPMNSSTHSHSSLSCLKSYFSRIYLILSARIFGSFYIFFFFNIINLFIILK